MTPRAAVLEDPEINTVVEVMGGVTEAKEVRMVCAYIHTKVSADRSSQEWSHLQPYSLSPNTFRPNQVVFGAIAKGKHVITANKALLAAFLPEIAALLKENPTVKFAYEAAVCGGIPIIHTLQNDYLGDQISQVCAGRKEW